MPQTSPTQISVINASTVLNDNDIRPVIEALQQQVSDDFFPAWGVDAKLTFIPTASAPPGDTWWLTILDDSDQAGALGYHDLTPRRVTARQGIRSHGSEIRQQLVGHRQSRIAGDA